MESLGIGLIGTGFMGKCHALAFGAVKAVMGDVPTPRLELLCDTPADKAAAMAEQFGFEQRFRDGCTVERHEGLAGTRAEVVQAAGHAFLAAAGFAADKSIDRQAGQVQYLPTQ